MTSYSMTKCLYIYFFVLFSRVSHLRHGKLQGRSKVSGREDRTSEVRDVQSAVPGTGDAVWEAKGCGWTGVREQQQDLPLLVSHVYGRLRHWSGDRDQIVGKVSPARRRKRLRDR